MPLRGAMRYDCLVFFSFGSNKRNGDRFERDALPLNQTVHKANAILLEFQQLQS